MLRKPRKYNPRNTEEYKHFRSLVVKRDKGKCQMPGCNSRRSLQVHHIKRYADAASSRLDPNNSICVCRNCHEKVLTGKESFYAPMLLQIVAENIAKQKGEK